MECGPTRVCELLVGLGGVEVLGVADGPGEPLGVHVRCRAARPVCGGCGQRLWSDGERAVVLVDLPAFGRPCRLVQQAAVALPSGWLRGGLGHRVGAGGSAAEGAFDEPGGAVGDPPGGTGPAPQRRRRRSGLWVAHRELGGQALGLCAAGSRHRQDLRGRDHASVEPDRSRPSAGSHTPAEPTEAAGGSRANPANDPPDATTSQPHRPVPTYKSAIHWRIGSCLRPPLR